PFALLPLVEIRRIGGVALGQARVDDFDAAAELDAGRARGLAHPFLPPDQLGRAEALLDEARRRADDLLLLALGEHHALGVAAQPLEHARQHAGNRVAPGAQRLAVGVHVDDRLARDAG